MISNIGPSTICRRAHICVRVFHTEVNVSMSSNPQINQRILHSNSRSPVSMQNQSEFRMGENLFKKTVAVGRTLWLQDLQASQNQTEKAFSFIGRGDRANENFGEGWQAVRLSRRHDWFGLAGFVFVASLLEQAFLSLGFCLSLGMSQCLGACRKEERLSKVWTSQAHR